MKHMTTLYDEHNPIANVGDIVKIAGYGDMLCEVISISHEKYVDREVEYETVHYETLSRKDGRNYYADQSEITIVERKEKTAERADKPALSKTEQIDDLLDQLRSAQALRLVYEGDRKYELAMCEIKAKLRDLTEATE